MGNASGYRAGSLKKSNPNNKPPASKLVAIVAIASTTARIFWDVVAG